MSTAPALLRSRRKTKPLPHQLLDHATVCLEEQLYSQAFSSLFNALVSGSTEIRTFPAQIPPPQHLALAATLIVHPQLTTRTLSKDKHAAADEALRYLRHLVKSVDPRTVEFGRAFAFAPRRSARESAREKRARNKAAVAALDGLNPGRAGGRGGEEEDFKPGNIRSVYVRESSLWSNAEDFWSVVGWAFNCSAVYPERWKRWEVWLELMLELLDGDLDARAEEAEASRGVDSESDPVTESLFAQYLLSVGNGRDNRRRMMRAIFADGGQKSLGEFGEVWQRETKGPKQKPDGHLKKRRKLDLENNEFGDYDEDSDLDESLRSADDVSVLDDPDPNTAARDSGDTWSSDDDDGSQISPNTSMNTTGDCTSLLFRQRLLALLVRLSSLSSTAFLDLEELLDLFTEFLRPLPLPTFQSFLLPSKTYLPPSTHAALNQMLLRPLLSAPATKYSPGGPTWELLERCYLPYAAHNSNVWDNAKVGLLVEGLLRFLARSGGLDPKKAVGLRKATESGMRARREKVEKRKRGIGRKEEEFAIEVMEASAERMVMVLELLEQGIANA